MVPKKSDKQQAGGESRESAMGDAVPHNGEEEQAARRAHMREQTMARQAAERKALPPAGEARIDRPARVDDAQRREADLRAELARINAEHRDWLREHGAADPPEGYQPPEGEGPGA